MQPTGSEIHRPPLSQVIRAHRHEIIDTWRRAIRAEGVAPGGLPEPALLDHVPPLLDRIADLADGLASGRTPVQAELGESQAHALERLEQGVRLADVVREYGLLRDCMFRVVAREVSLSPEDANMVSRAIDEAMFITAARYEAASNRLFRALDALTADAVAGQSLEELLQGLLKPITSVSPAIDTCAIYLREGDRLRVRAAVGFADARDPGYSLALGEGFAGTIAATGRPLLLRQAALDPLVRSEFLRARGIRALYGVPLRAGDEVVGVVQVGSRRSSDFSDEEKLLFRTVSGRATALIVEAELREQERAARARAEHEAALLDGILRASVDSIAVFDRDGRYLYLSPSVARRYGLPAEAVRGRRLRELALSPSDVPPIEAVLQRVIDQGRPEHGERMQTTAGGPRHFEFIISPVIEPDGSVQSAVAIGRDTTERKREEAARRESEARLALALEAGGLGTWEWSEATGALRLDAPAREIIGEPAETPSLEALRARTDPDEQARLRTAVEAARHTEAGSFQVELRARRDGGERWVAVQGRILFDEARHPARILGTLQDVTERKRAQDELAESLRMAETFISVLSHDLRTPLSAIHMGAALLARKADLAPGPARTAGRILSSAERMARMISDLLDYSRVRAGVGVPLTPRPVDALEVCRTAVEELEVVHPHRTVFVEAEGDTSGSWDRDRVLQVVVNLGSNALRYSDPETPVTVRLEGRADEVQIEVHNLGAPIPAELLPHLFDPFRKGQHTGTRPDSIGLGLYIVRTIVEAHGGSIAVRSRAGEGTTFTVRLPRRR